MLSMVSNQKFWQIMKGKRPSSFLFIVSLLSIIVIYGDESLFVNSDPNPNDGNPNPDDGISNHEDDDSMTLELIHRDSHKWHQNHRKLPKSQRQLIIERHLRDLNRQKVKHPLRKDGIKLTMESGSDLGIGEYLVEVKLGTPPKTYTLVLDTGSDLTWVNCRYDCNGCHHSKTRDAFYGDQERFYTGYADTGVVNVFQAHRSSSFKPIPCDSVQCRKGLARQGSMRICPTPTSHCMYNISYLGGKVTKGFFAEEILRAPLTTTGKTLKVQHMVIGCTETVFGGLKTDGVLGLGFTNSSWTEKSARNFGPKFSYCLMDWSYHMNVKNYITFGSNKKAAGHPSFTTIQYFLPQSGYYSVNISGISVGGRLLEIPSYIWHYDIVTGGGMIIDSGTTNTWLAAPAYYPVMDEYLKTFEKFTPVIPPEPIPFEMCFKAKGSDVSSFPKLQFHFVNGAVFEPVLNNFFVELSPGDRCLAIVKSNTYVGSLIGNTMMQNFLWEHNMDERTIGFTPSSCT